MVEISGTSKKPKNSCPINFLFLDIFLSESFDIFSSQAYVSPKTSLNEEFERHNAKVDTLLAGLAENTELNGERIEIELKKHRRKVADVIEANPA